MQEENKKTAEQTGRDSAEQNVPASPQDAEEPEARGHWGRKILAAILALALLIPACAYFLWQWYGQFIRTQAPLAGETIIEIPKGAGTRQIGALLAEKHVLPEAGLRYLACLHFSGLRGKLKAGEYSFAPGITPPEALLKIARGKVVIHQVTVVEGLRLEQIAAVFASGGWVKPERFLELARDPNFTHALGISADNLEGYLFPDTYSVERGMSEEEILTRMTKRFIEVWESLARTEGMKDAGREKRTLSQHELLTLASVVEKETGLASERRMIARVFLNRLKLGMPLQSDPTVIYGLGAGYDGKLHKADLRIQHPYNTYVIPALPPGPICSPGQAALEAALNPASSEALYFVARNDGSHAFSKTLAEHNRAVQMYQKAQGPRAGAETRGKPAP